MDDSAVICDEIIYAEEKILMKKNYIVKHKISIFYLPFY